MKYASMFTMVICLLISANTLAKGKSTEPNKRELSEILKVENVKSQALTKKAKKLEKRKQRFEKLMDKYQRATDEGRIIGAALFAFFLGWSGIHRVYLGGSPLLILGYIFTFGGLFGILPLIDFIRIVASGTDHYEENDRLFAAFENFGNYE